MSRWNKIIFNKHHSSQVCHFVNICQVQQPASSISMRNCVTHHFLWFNCKMNLTFSNPKLVRWMFYHIFQHLKDVIAVQRHTNIKICIFLQFCYVQFYSIIYYVTGTVTIFKTTGVKEVAFVLLDCGNLF